VKFVYVVSRSNQTWFHRFSCHSLTQNITHSLIRSKLSVISPHLELKKELKKTIWETNLIYQHIFLLQTMNNLKFILFLRPKEDTNLLLNKVHSLPLRPTGSSSMITKRKWPIILKLLNTQFILYLLNRENSIMKTMIFLTQQRNLNEDKSWKHL